jgi:hypothetical protein
MKLTKGEILALQHRIEVPECIFESIGRGDSWTEIDYEFDRAIDNVSTQMERGYVVTEALSDLEKQILGDCLDCGTYWQCHEIESSQKRAAVEKIGWNLVDKFEANGIPVCRDLLIFR